MKIPVCVMGFYFTRIPVWIISEKINDSNSKSADRTRQGELAELGQTLDRLDTSYLDLWQIH
jgi:aryl-alcohol dehydrogenase-like predicted oxidoreductase